MALVAAVAVAVRLPGALSYSLWGDEIPSARALSQPDLHGLLTQVRLRESTPPAWYVVVWTVHRLGVLLEELRLASVACSAALVVLTMVLASRLMPHWAAAVASLTVALGLQFVVHGRELRAYALFMLLALLFAYLLDAASTRADWKRLCGLAACVALGTLTHYFFFFTAACGAFWVWSSPRTRRNRRRLTAALVAGAAPFLAWLPAFQAQLSSGHTESIGGFNSPTVASLPAALFPDARLLYHH